MPTFQELRTAARHKLCPYCGGSLVPDWDNEKGCDVLRCSQDHTFTDPKDCAPKRGIETLETEATLATTDQRVKRRDVKKDIDTFRSLGYME